jgi:hypothetical protein
MNTKSTTSLKGNLFFDHTINKIVAFGSVSITPTNPHVGLEAVGQVVRDSENKSIRVSVLRGDGSVDLSLIPKRWAGNGLLGYPAPLWSSSSFLALFPARSFHANSFSLLARFLLDTLSSLLDLVLFLARSLFSLFSPFSLFFTLTFLAPLAPRFSRSPSFSRSFAHFSRSSAASLPSKFTIETIPSETRYFGQSKFPNFRIWKYFKFAFELFTNPKNSRRIGYLFVEHKKTGDPPVSTFGAFQTKVGPSETRMLDRRKFGFWAKLDELQVLESKYPTCNI